MQISASPKLQLEYSLMNTLTMKKAALNSFLTGINHPDQIDISTDILRADILPACAEYRHIIES